MASSLVPTDRDVVLGRGFAIMNHPGNLALRALVRSRRPEFLRSNKVQKRALANAMVDDIRRGGGRFLAEAPTAGGGTAAAAGTHLRDRVWTEVARGKAVEKVMHRLREREGGDGGKGAAGAAPAMAWHEAVAAAPSAGALPLQNPLGSAQPTSVGNASLGAVQHALLAGYLQSMQQSNLSSVPGMNAAPLNSLPNNLLGMNAASLNGLLGNAMGSIMIPQQAFLGNNSLGQFPGAMAGLLQAPQSLGSGALGAAAVSASVLQQSLGGACSAALGQRGATAAQSTSYSSNCKRPVSAAMGMTNAGTPSPHVGAIGKSEEIAATGTPSPHLGAIGKSEEIAAADITKEAATGTISLRDWISSSSKAASNDGYVTSAVDLAFVMATKLSEMIAGGSNLSVHDITVESVLLSLNQPFQLQPSHIPSINDVGFASKRGSANASPPTNESAPLLPRDACASLGKLLLAVFSKDPTSSSVAVSHPNERGSDGAPPPKKRKMKASTKANELLRGLGVPLSIRHLVCDLLDAGHVPCPSTAITSIDEALYDLTQMKAKPKLFLFDRTCPRQALNDACIFGNTDESLIGRGPELNSLLEARNRVAAHIAGESSNDEPTSDQSCPVLCEAVFLGGYAGSGKSSLLRSLMSSCDVESWFVLSFKFDKQTDGSTTFFKELDNFFLANSQTNSERSPSTNMAFQKICNAISSSVDCDGLEQLSVLLPSLTTIFPGIAVKTNARDLGIGSMDKVGSTRKRLHKLIHVLLMSICSAGRPVLFVVDDMQWCGSFLLEVLQLTLNESKVSHDSCRKGYFIAGAYRTNEVAENDDLMQKMNHMTQSKEANVKTIAVGPLNKEAVTRLIAPKLCLPWRYTQELAELVHKKSRGNPFFITQFLRAIVQNKMLQYSVKSKRFIWDIDIVDMQSISDEVAGLLAASFSQLPSQQVETMRVLSCFGSQVDEDTINALDRNAVLPFSMIDQMDGALKEGIMEKAGPIFQFTHDIIQQTLYAGVPYCDVSRLHKTIGEILLSAAGDETAMYLLGVDQIDLYLQDGSPNPDERAQYASCNARAAKLAVASSSFDQAQSYIDAGLKLLETNHWETQYALSLELFDLSSTVSYINGNTTKLATQLDAIIKHAKSVEDSSEASLLLVKFLASSFQFADARKNCILILSNLGEDALPLDVSVPHVQTEIMPALITALKDVTYDSLKALPPLTDSNKLRAMKVLSMLCMVSVLSKPVLLPVYSQRMVSLSLEWGFCDDSIVGLATAIYSVFLYADDNQLAIRVGKVCEALVEESPKRHQLRARLCQELVATMKLMHEPLRDVAALFPSLYNSGMISGDIENAMLCRWAYIGAGFWGGALALDSVAKHAVTCMKEATKYKQLTVKYSAMVIYESCLHLSGGSRDDTIERKTLDEIMDMGVGTGNHWLIYQTFMCQLTNYFWLREYTKLASLSEQFSAKHPSSQEKRISHTIRSFYEGLACLSLARGSPKASWRTMGEKSAAHMEELARTMSKRNFQNKAELLRAELHFLNGDNESAEAAYVASIEAARNNFVHEEALACELYGLFCIENRMREKGQEQLRLALDKYEQWGATTKVNKLQLYIDVVEAGHV